jgi:ABC-2 type transport system permease protein
MAIRIGKTATVVRREYLERVKRKSFLIGTLLGPVLIAGMILVPGLLMSASTRSQWRISVVDQGGEIFPQLKTALDDTLKSGQPAYILQEIPSTPEQLEANRIKLNAQVAQGLISGYLIIGSDILSVGEAEFCAKNVGDYSTIGEIRAALSRIVVEMRLNQEGLDPERINSLTRGVRMRTMKVGQGGERESGFDQVFVETMVFVMILYMTILLYGVTVMRGVIEEKSSRIVELLLSSVRSTQLMAGKILGVGCVGLTQYLIWIAFGLGLSAFGAVYLGLGQIIRAISASTFLFFLLFYLLGYFLYATLYAGVGAICTSEQDAQQIQFPIILMLILPLMLAGSIIRNPEGSLATVLSLIPFFSPMLMFLRINLVTPPLGQILASIFLLLLSIFLMIWLVAKIFRVGLLMYGKKPTLREILRWMRAG